MKTLLRSMMIVCMLTALLSVAPAPALAQVEEGQAGIPAGLQEAILSSTAQAFEESGGKYKTSAGEMAYELSANGLQAGGQGLQWGISLQAFGRGTQMLDVSSPEMSQTEGRLEYRRRGVTEWYRDTALGVEQGFTIHESPIGEDELVVQLDVETDLEGVLDEDGRGLSFPGPDGQTLRYDHLKVYDANGVELDARMTYEPGKVQILVRDRGAAYPITIDPLIYLEQDAIAWDGSASEYFGNSVALSSDTALVGAGYDNVGANNEQGSAYIFVRSGTTWTQQAQLTASDGAAHDFFGYSVALSGDTALVGANWDDVGANGEQGSAYVFVRSGTMWIQQALLTASDGAAGDHFGNTVALSGDTALVGASYDDVGANSSQGSAYIFVRSGTTWTQQAQLTASDGAGGDDFGNSVAISGDTALVGAAYDDVVANNNQGSAYVFVRAGTIWTQQAQLTALDGAVDDNFAFSVTLSGDTALVGALYDDVGANNDQGSAYIFMRRGTTWDQQAHLTASDGEANDLFGDSVALSGDTVLMGVGLDDVGANINQGSAYFYQAYRTDADLVVSAVRGTSGALHPGLGYFLTTSVMNYGPQTATGVILHVGLPSGLTYVSHTVKRGSYTPSTNSWSVGSLGMGVSATLTILVVVDPIPSQTLVFAPYSLARDTNDANNQASLSLPVFTLHEIALNGGFNTYVGTSKIPQNWVAANFASTDGKITTVKKEGTASVKISNTTAKTKTLTQTLNLSGGADDEFGFSFWAKGVSIPVAGICRAQVFLYNGAALVTTKTVNCSTGTYGFTQKSLFFLSPGSYTRVVIKLTYAKATGTIYFDGLSLMKAP